MNSRPFLSVVVPTCHRNDLLAKCLDCLSPGKQALPAGEYEVIVTDDGRQATAEEMVRKDYPWAAWVPGPKDGPAANRNNGAAKARGEWIVFVDDDCLPDSRWLAVVAETARTKDVGVVEGKTFIPDLVDSPFKEGAENLTGDSFWSCNLAVRRSVFEEIGGFDADFKEAAVEDMEFAARFKRRGVRHVFVPEALVLHPVRDVTWKQIWRRTKMARWHQLLSLKNNSGAAQLPRAVAVIKILVDAFVTQCRTTWHLVSKHDPRKWRRRFFWQAWRWLTLPIIVPYTAFWHLRFRRMLEERHRGNPQP